MDSVQSSFSLLRLPNTEVLCLNTIRERKETAVGKYLIYYFSTCILFFAWFPQRQMQFIVHNSADHTTPSLTKTKVIDNVSGTITTSTRSIQTKSKSIFFDRKSCSYKAK